MEISRLQQLITGGVTVSDQTVRDAYNIQGTKVKFDYAVISLEDLKKTINPSDADLQAFFKQNSERYADAVPETRKLAYVAFDASTKLPGGEAPPSPTPTFRPTTTRTRPTTRPTSRPRPATSSSPSQLARTPATDSAAKAKAQDVLKQLQSGGKFADLAKKYSDDPGSKDQGGELPMMSTSGLDPAYAKAAMALSPGQTSGLVRSQFGFHHIIQTEQKQVAGTKAGSPT